MNIEQRDLNSKRSENNDYINNVEHEKISRLQASFQGVVEREELLSKIIEFFPYPIQVYSKDGTSVMVNNALLVEFEIPDKDMVVGKYNILKDPDIEKYGLIERVKDVFKGKTLYLSDLKVPLKSVRECYSISNSDIDSIYQDITAFPITDSKGEVSYIVIIFITRRIYKGKESIVKAKEYFRNNWDKEYNINEVACVTNLSPYHFSRLFKNDVGVTPYNYYLSIKIEKLKEKLCDINLSITEAFSACGVDYNGNFARIFKKHVGLTPSQYRETILNK